MASESSDDRESLARVFMTEALLEGKVLVCGSAVEVGTDSLCFGAITGQ